MTLSLLSATSVSLSLPLFFFWLESNQLSTDLRKQFPKFSFSWSVTDVNNSGDFTMCHGSCLKFVSKHLTKARCQGMRILEVGSLNVNGSSRSIIEPFAPYEYIGVDIIPGMGVDSIYSVLSLIPAYGKDSFDIVIATELLEHVYNWKAAISNIKNVCKPGGSILLTTRSPGFPYHAYPNDFWRFTIKDFRYIFSDFYILDLIPDPFVKGVFIIAHKPLPYSEVNLSNYGVFRVKPPEPKP